MALKKYTLTDTQYASLMKACKPTPVMFLTGGQRMFRTPQENANAAWKDLGEELGFDSMTVEPIPGLSDKHFKANGIPTTS